jgi:hypothetical protein
VKELRCEGVRNRSDASDATTVHCQTVSLRPLTHRSSHQILLACETAHLKKQRRPDLRPQFLLIATNFRTPDAPQLPSTNYAQETVSARLYYFYQLSTHQQRSEDLRRCKALINVTEGSLHGAVYLTQCINAS